jgi:hypothetical protein
MSIIYQQARELAQQRLDVTFPVKDKDEPTIVENATVEKIYGWIFFYRQGMNPPTSDEAQDRFDDPIFVMRDSGKVYFPTVFHPSIAEQIKIFEALYVNPHDWELDRINEYRPIRFVAAAIMGNTRELQEFLSLGVDVNCVGELEISALIGAAMHDRIDTMRFLLEHGANINQCDYAGWTPLHASIESGAFEAACWLIRYGANVTIQDKEGNTPMNRVSRFDDRRAAQLVDLLVQRGGNVNAADYNGNTALMMAALQGHKRTVGRLLRYGADVTMSNTEGKTASDWTKDRSILKQLNVYASRKKP